MVPVRVDVALDEVAAEPGVGAQRPLEIDERRRAERAERGDARVSGETSAWTPSASAETTVRQTPLTARLSPGVSSGSERRRHAAGTRPASA